MYYVYNFSQLNSHNLHSRLRPAILAFPQPEDTVSAGSNPFSQAARVDDCGALDSTDEVVEV